MDFAKFLRAHFYTDTSGGCFRSMNVILVLLLLTLSRHLSHGYFFADPIDDSHLM